MNEVKYRNICDPINILRTIACLIVFILHTLIYSQFAGVDIYKQAQTNPLIFLIKTPAWAGVWIFIILGGYLAGKSFFTGRYEFSVKGFGKYYLKK